MHLFSRLVEYAQYLKVEIKTTACDYYTFEAIKSIDEIVVSGESFLEFDYKHGDLSMVELIAIKAIEHVKIEMKPKSDFGSTTNQATEAPGPKRDPYAQALSGFYTYEKHMEAQQQHYTNLSGPGTMGRKLVEEHRFITLPNHIDPVMVITRGPQGCGKTKVLDLIENVLSVVKAKI
jgi:hypothetical protein